MLIKQYIDDSSVWDRGANSVNMKKVCVYIENQSTV